MAFFHNMPEYKKQEKKTKRNAGWDEEGSGYRSRGQSEKGEYRGARGRNGAAAEYRGRRTGDTGAYGKRKPAYEHARNDSDAAAGRGTGRNFRGERQRPSRPMNSERSVPEQKTENQYREFEYKKPEIVSAETARETNEEFILTGRNPIREALKNDRDLEKLLVQKGELSGSAREIVAVAKEKKIMVQVVEKSRLDEITPHHQGLIAIASAYQYAEMDELYKTARERNEDPFFILLDGITDPHNLGAIIRTAECAGAHGIIVPQHRSVGLTPAAVKASAGAVEHVKVARVTNINRTIEELQKNNIWVYGLSMEGTDYEQIDFQGGIALVIGAEGDGISRLTADKCDQVVSLPIRGQIDSLNASVAAGIMMYRVLSCRQRK